MTEKEQRDKPVILIVDDDRMMRIMLRRVFVAADFHTIEADNGVAAIDIYQQTQPDMVILDVLMPEKDGFDTCKEIREELDGVHIPILMMTGLDDLESINRAYDCGATDFITKPLNFPLLVHRIKYMLRSNQVFLDLQLHKEKLDSAQKIAKLGYWYLALNNRNLTLSDSVADVFSMPPTQPALPLPIFLRKIVPADRHRIRKQINSAIQTGQAFTFETTIKISHDSAMSIYVYGMVKSDPDGSPIAIEGVLQDISELKQAHHELKASEEKFGYLFQFSNDAIIVHDDAGQIIDANQKALTKFKLTEKRAKTTHINQLQVDSESSETSLNRSRLFEDGHVVYESNYADTVDKEFPAEVSASRFAVNGQFVTQLVIRDITERKRAEEEISFLAYKDPLTSLPNKRLFDDRVKQAIQLARRNNFLLAVMFLDIDQFKRINDTLGPTIGDTLLTMVGERLQDVVRNSDSIARHSALEKTLARHAGDEFTVLLTGLNTVRGAALVAQRLVECLSEPFVVNSQEVFIGASVGVSLYPQDGVDSDALLKNAESTMYHVKQNDRGNYQFYSKEINAAALARFELENALRTAIENDELEVYYQPKVALDTNEVCGAEALLRWTRKDGTMVSPGEFIPVAEESGLILPLGEWVLREVCRQNKAWQDQGCAPISIAVNMSGVQFSQNNIVEIVRSAFESPSLEPRWLEIEITESSIMHDAETTIHTLKAFKEMGILLAIDDFGTGFSSLNYLKQFPLDYLKIDRSFVQNVDKDASGEAITRAIIALGHSLQLKLVAEGVETDAEKQYLIDQQCDQMQGFLFSRPVPAKEFVKFIRPNNVVSIDAS